MSMGFSRQESWRGLPRSPPGYLSYAGIKSKSLTYPALAGRFFTTSTLRMLVFSHPVMLTLCDPMDYITPGHHVPHHLLKLTQVHVHCTVMPSSPLILWCLLLLLPSIFPRIGDFSNEMTVHIRWPKYWSFSFSISPSNKYSGLISLMIYWFDLLAVQGTFRSPLAPQFEGINSLAFCLLYSPVLTTIHDHWEDHSLDNLDLCRQNNGSDFQHTVKVSRSFPAKKQSFSDFIAAVTICSDFRAQKEEICHRFHLFSFFLPWSNQTGCHDLSFLFFLVLSQLFDSPPSRTSSRGFLVPLPFLPLDWYCPHIWDC